VSFPANSPAGAPRDAAAVILIRHQTSRDNPEVFWVRRRESLAFLGGYHAFPGGQFEASDSEVEVLNCGPPDRATAISCAARELFEEAGVLVARGGETLTVGQRASLLDDLESRRMSWPQLLQHYALHLDAHDFTFAGRWVTPPFAPRRFDTWFFLVNCPARQEPRLMPDGELDRGEWIAACEACARWDRSEVVAVPPTMHALRTLSRGLTGDLVERFLSVPHAHQEPVRRIEFRPGYICFPVRSPTRPPATHTNCYLIHNAREFVIVDPGSPYEDEQLALADCIDDLIRAGKTARMIIITHLHPDHIGGVNALRDHLAANHHLSIPVAAHRLTAAALDGQVAVDRLIEDGEFIELEGEPPIALRALHTPGHARGHLCFHDARTGALLTGDNIVGFGSVLIDPPEGHMADYVASLARMKELRNLSVLFGGHGPAVAAPYRKINEYISHRLEREASILDAVRDGAGTPSEIVARVYTDVSPKAHAMAERAVMAHLDKLQDEGLVVGDVEDTFRAT
jgi:endoribonuclease LACTB2